MSRLSRREFVGCAAGGVSLAAGLPAAIARVPAKLDVHRQILERAAEQQARRRAEFAAVKTLSELKSLQQSLRDKFLRLLGGLPERAGIPPAHKTGEIDADGYRIEKLAFESLPGYFVSALLYRPKHLASPAPAIVSPCGHSPEGKAAGTYQMLHVNLAKRGYVVLTYDPVGQAERSQFWDAAHGKSRFNLTCGEHAVLGNPLYLLGSSLARFRIWDGLRALDYLASLQEVDPTRIGCVGNSGGGTLTAYLAALDPRVAAAAIGCYITNLPRRMGNRIEADPDSDPEQDIFGFVGEGIDHAGLLALIAPRPTLLATAKFDFFPIEGAIESFDEARRLYEVAGVGDRIARAEAPERHGLSLRLREAVYGWFERWLGGRDVDGPLAETPVTPRPARELLVCAEGQVNRTFKSRPLLPLALEEFDRAPKRARMPLQKLLRLDRDAAAPLVEVGNEKQSATTAILCVNGNETADWRDEQAFLQVLRQRGYAVFVVDPRGVGRQRPKLSIKGHDYADPLAGVEENIAYNAFLTGQSLLAMRVADVLAAVRSIKPKTPAGRLMICGRRDAAVVALLAAASEPSIDRVAAEEMLLSLRSLFEAEGRAINAASILPGMLRDFGDVGDVLAQIAPRRVLLAAGVGAPPKVGTTVHVAAERFSSDPQRLIDWLAS